MNIRLRLMVIALGALVVLATYTFPYWLPLLQDDAAGALIPELSAEQNAAFNLLPVARQQDYLAIRSAEPNVALRMLTAALGTDLVVPEAEQVQPQREGQIAALTGEFETLTPNRFAQGTVTLYELPDGGRYLWLADFSVVNGPGLRLFLSSIDTAALDALTANDDEADDEYRITARDLALDPLRANVGAQAYDVPSEENLALYNSVLIYSTDLDLLYSIADLN